MNHCSLIKIYGEKIFKGLQISEKISGKICLGSQDHWIKKASLTFLKWKTEKFIVVHEETLTIEKLE